MPHALVVSYYFPPIGGTTVRRVLRFLRHLPKHGWRCTVVCADHPYHPFHPDDPEALAHLPPAEAILRAPARAGLERLATLGYRGLVRLHPLAERDGQPPERKAGSRLRRLLHETALFPDPKWPWIRGAVAASLGRAERDPYDLVFVTGYPWSAFLVARRVAEALKIPFVLDFRDGWTHDPREIWTGPRNRRLERDLVARAARVTAATPWIRDRLRESCPEVEAARVVTLTNGYDPDEFPPVRESLVDPARFVLTYTGTFNDRLPPSPFDQTPYFLLEAAARLPPGIRSLLRVRLVGTLGPAYREHIRALALDDVVDVVGPVSHQDALRYQLASDALLVVVYDCAWAPAVLTGKLLEYVGAGKPILALVPEGEASKLVRSRELGWVEPPRDVEGIRNRLVRLIESWRAGTLPRASPAIPELSAEWLTGQLASILDAAIS